MSLFPRSYSASQSLYLLLFFIFFAYLSFLGPMVTEDTSSYVTFQAFRSPVYPLVLWGNGLIFGEGQYWTLSLFQILLGLFSIHFLIKKMKVVLSLDEWILPILVLILSLPLYGPTYTANRILTEAICYPVFLMAFGFLLEGVLQKRRSALCAFLVCMGALILTRRQFLFLYPFCFVLFLSLSFALPFALRPLFKFNKTFLWGGLCLVFLTTEGIERGLSYLRNGHFSSAPFLGSEMIVSAVYLSNPQDHTLFKDPLQRQIFQDIWRDVSEKKWAAHFVNAGKAHKRFLSEHYMLHYNDIRWGSLQGALRHNGVLDPWEVDRVTFHIALTLFKANFLKFLELWGLMILFSWGGYYWCFLCGLTFLIASYLLFWCQRREGVPVLMALLLGLCNETSVALVEELIPRYTLYTQTLILMTFFLIVSQGLGGEKRPLTPPRSSKI